MPDLLLELFSEEIPARMQVDALDNLVNSLSRGLSTAGFRDTKSADWLNGFVTPRRIAVWVKNLPLAQPDVSTEIKGPKVNAPQAAIDGFVKKNGLVLEQLENRDGVYFATIHQKGKPTTEVLKPLIEDILAHFPWPKSMRWGAGSVTWVRPLHSILCIFDSQVVPLQFGGIKAGNVTYGHRFLAPQAITIANPADYESALQKAHVIADREKRKVEILRQAEKSAAAKGLTLKKDDALLEEVTGLVEWPVVLMGAIDAQFMDLPPEVLAMVMRSHQKYFSLLPSPSGRGQGEGVSTQALSMDDLPHPYPLPRGEGVALAPHFLITANMQTADNGKAIIAGNERVLRARFSDARFFWDQDRKKPLSEWTKGLENVTFHAKLGTVADKVERIKALALQLAPSLTLPRCAGEGTSVSPLPEGGRVGEGDFATQIERGASLCKADLVTGMVGEFAELQGIMGRYYALQQNEKPEVADAIRDHYKPQGPNDSVPTQPVSICIALADKLDTLVGMFTFNERPTGSKDPFALRRAALGAIRIILDNNIRIRLLLIFDKAYDNYEFGGSSLASSRHYTISHELLSFFIDRLIVQLKDSGIRHDVINAVVANGDDDLVRIVERAKALQDFLATNDGSNLLIAYKRASNILPDEEKKDKKIYDGSATVSTNAKPRSIENALNKATGALETCIREERFNDAMDILANLRKPIDEFFENTLINNPDETIREDNLKILAQIRRDFNWLADFSRIESDGKEQRKAT